MAEILGLGVTHYPGLLVDPPYWSRFTERGAQSGRIPAELFADVEGWPAPMRAEWSDDHVVLETPGGGGYGASEAAGE
jgi:hypothetical protein